MGDVLWDLHDLKDLVLLSWCQVAQQTFKGLVKSMPWCVSAV